MNILEKAELITSIHHVDRFSKSAIPIHNSEISEILDRRKKRKAIAKRYALQANAVKMAHYLCEMKQQPLVQVKDDVTLCRGVLRTATNL